MGGRRKSTDHGAKLCQVALIAFTNAAEARGSDDSSTLESASKLDALHMLARGSLAPKSAKRMECVQLAGAFKALFLREPSLWFGLRFYGDVSATFNGAWGHPALT